jgi:hypothetical protein
MKNLRALFLLLCPAGMMQATIVYATFTGETPTNTVDQQILDRSSNSSNYGLSVGLMNFQFLSGDLLPATGLNFYGFGIEPDEFVTAGNNVQDMMIQVPVVRVGNGGAAESSTFGIAGFALIGLSRLRRRR